MFDLSAEQLQRYRRNIILPGVGEEGQKKLLAGRVLVVGNGGLGSPVAYYLAAAGVGKLGLVDDDVVDLTNLQRQILHNTNDLGRPKVESAREKLSKLNPDIEIVTYGYRLSKDNILDIIKDYDIVVDATDNLASRYIINEGCVRAGKPFVHGGILRFAGQLTTVKPKEGPCFVCIFREPPPPEAMAKVEEGVLGVLPGVIGSLQTTEVIKYFFGVGELLIGRLLTYNALTMSFREVAIERNPECPICGTTDGH